MYISATNLRKPLIKYNILLYSIFRNASSAKLIHNYETTNDIYMILKIYIFLEEGTPKCSFEIEASYYGL